ncbi:MAG: hypothetical protein E5V63_30415, partial [Mesorhizobium sp.]
MSAIATELPAAELSRGAGLPKWLAPLILVAFAYTVVPLIGGSYLFEAILLPFLALSLAGIAGEEVQP